ncbi:MAG: hypothetical protein O6945_02100 [Gammaproteobacteria bacterium]|nr:hypothetical protein [Gammaproteobacteria bacterium]
MYLKRILYYFAVVIFSLSYAFVYSEDAPPRGLTVNLFQVAVGRAQEFEQVSMKFKAAADKIKSPEYFGYSPGIGNNDLYAFVSPFNSYQEFATQQNVLAEVYEGEELAEIGQMFQDSVTSTDSYVIVPRPDLGIAGPEFETPPEILLLIAVTVKNGMGLQFEAYLEKLVEATKATAPDLYYNAFQPGLGSGLIWRFGIAQNWVDLDTQPKPIPQRLTEHFGRRNGERIFQDGQDAIESVEFTVSRFRPDLSHSN